MRRTDWQAQAEKGVALLQQGQHKQALIHLQRASRRAPRERYVRYWLANAYRMTGDTGRARKIFGKLLAEMPGDFEISFALAFLLRDAGLPGDAADALLEAAGQNGLALQQLLQIAGFLRDSNQYDAAITVCEKALELSPDQVDLHFKLGRLYQATGRFDDALRALRKTLDLQPSTGPAWTVLAQQKRFDSTEDPDYKRMEEATGQSYGPEADMCIAFAIGKALDDLQQWPRAWEQYRIGNRLASSTRPWSPARWKKFVERSISNAATAAKPASAPARNAVFIVGMPRSGTTLLEQMLDRHPNITGRGELNVLSHFAAQSPAPGTLDEAQRQEMADALWTQMRLDGPESDFYIDKNPLNFRYVDVMMELLPTAKVLHVTRDGRDTCTSCFFQLFEHEDSAFSNNLDHLVDFYAGYRRLLSHWQSVYADRVFEVRYAELVQFGHDVLAGALDFLGADWSDAVIQVADQERVIRTASVWQARQPVYSRSVDRWRNYYDQAPGFYDRLAAIDSDFETREGDD